METIMINIIYASDNKTGGWVTFTYHLTRALDAVGEPWRLLKINPTGRSGAQDFGYGLEFYNASIEDALALPGVTLISAAAKQYAEPVGVLLEYGARLVLHDPTELKAGLAGAKVTDPWTIRRAVAAQVPSTFIRHPYARSERPAKLPKRQGAVSTSRIDFDKHTEIILAANRLGAKIRIHGFENRLYTKFKIMPEFPEWEQSLCAYPRTPEAAFNLLLGAKFMVDMSAIKGDGGGTQYTFLEAWDAGAVPIINAAWVRSKDDMVPSVNCYAAGSPAELRAYARYTGSVEDMVFAGEQQLKKHSPRTIGRQVMKWLTA